MNLEKIKDRCVIDAETGCWHWRGAMNTDKAGAGVPVIWNGKRSVTGMRLVFELAKRPLLPGESPWRTCRCLDCLAPAHLRAGTKAAWGAWRKANGFAKIGPEALAANMLSKRRLAAEDGAEKAAAIRSSTESGAELARRTGLSKTAVNRIRNGKAWAETVPQASVFTWRP